MTYIRRWFWEQQVLKLVIYESQRRIYMEEQNSNYLLRKTKLKAIFALLQRCLTYLKSTFGTVWCRSRCSINSTYVIFPIFPDFQINIKLWVYIYKKFYSKNFGREILKALFYISFVILFVTNKETFFYSKLYKMHLISIIEVRENTTHAGRSGYTC